MKRCSSLFCIVAACLLTISLCAPVWAASTQTQPKSETKTPAKAQTKAPAKAAVKAPGKVNAPSCSRDEAKFQLDTAARSHLERVARTLRPNMDNKEVVSQGSGFVAKYMVVDSARMTTELADMKPVPGSEYVGNMVYVVHEYQCTGATKQEALNGTFQKAKSRRVREFTRYADGKWQL